MQLFDGRLLVVLHGQDHPFRAEDLAQNPHAAQDLFRAGAQKGIVGGDIGLAFAGVGNEGIHMAHGGHGLHGAGEGGAAHAHNARLSDGVENFVVAQILYVFAGQGGGEGRVLEIVVNDHGQHIPAAGVGPGFYGGDGAGDRRVNRHAQSFAVADLLPQKNMVAHLYQGNAGRADVLLHGNHHLPGGDG